MPKAEIGKNKLLGINLEGSNGPRALCSLPPTYSEAIDTARRIWGIHRVRPIRILVVAEQLGSEPRLVDPESWPILRDQFQSAIFQTLDSPISIYSSRYEAFEVYGVVNMPMKHIKTQVSDKIGIPVERIKLWSPDPLGKKIIYCDDDVVRKSFFSSQRPTRISMQISPSTEKFAWLEYL
ncbi:hypothetical protein CPB86DRAFT_783715 [Serendipita vermifera]|nr:hypothetical protein CPB86DRAFT_783715 [Serendipita vermifera]